MILVILTNLTNLTNFDGWMQWRGYWHGAPFSPIWSNLNPTSWLDFVRDWRGESYLEVGGGWKARGEGRGRRWENSKDSKSIENQLKQYIHKMGDLMEVGGAETSSKGAGEETRGEEVQVEVKGKAKYSPSNNNIYFPPPHPHPSPSPPFPPPPSFSYLFSLFPFLPVHFTFRRIHVENSYIQPPSPPPPPPPSDD